MLVSSMVLFLRFSEIKVYEDGKKYDETYNMDYTIGCCAQLIPEGDCRNEKYEVEQRQRSKRMVPHLLDN